MGGLLLESLLLAVAKMQVLLFFLKTKMQYYVLGESRGMVPDVPVRLFYGRVPWANSLTHASIHQGLTEK